MKKLVFAAALLGGSMAALADGVATDAPMVVESNAMIISKFAALGIKVTQVKPTPVPGMNELLTDKGVLYASDNGQYLFQGTLIDIDGRKNLTEEALGQVRQEGIAQYEDSMIVYKAEHEKGKITVFTDITCGYCRKLHRELDDFLKAGITVRYLAYPRAGIGSSGYTDLMNVWCAADPKQALTDAKAGNKTAKAENCTAPLAEHYQLGQSFGINGTPAIILEDGTMIPGYQPAAAISNAIDAMKTAAQADAAEEMKAGS